MRRRATLRRGPWLAALWALALVMPVPVALAQSIPPSFGQAVPTDRATPILTIDQDRLFRESAYGRHVEEDLEALTSELAAENRRIEAELTEEERLLTEQRPTLDPKAFTSRADAFDARVEEIRARQDAKGRALARRSELARGEFLRNVLPVLSALMQERGAVAILNAQTIFLSLGAIDITDRAIERIDQRIGRGPGLAPLPDEAGGDAAPGPADAGSDAGTSGGASDGTADGATGAPQDGGAPTAQPPR